MFLIRNVAVVVLLSVLIVFPSSARSDEVMRRGLFVSVLDRHPVLASREDIVTLISYAKRAGIKVLFVQVYRANKSWFPSKVADSGPYDMCLKSLGEDPLAFLIKQAHSAGIEVHAWLNLLSLSKNDQAKILTKYGPDILTRNITLKKTLQDYLIDNQYFLEPGDARVRQELLSVVAEVVRAYPTLDGIQFDYIRYPDTNPRYGYTTTNIKRFKQETGLKEIVEEDPIWRQWKRDQVTELVEVLTHKARTIRPKIQVSTTGCVSYVRAREEAFQDWPLWLNERTVDFVTIMSYPPDLPTFKKNIADALKRVDDPNKINIAIGAYKFANNPDVYQAQFDLCKETKAGGCVVFHYDSLRGAKALAQITEDEGK